MKKSTIYSIGHGRKPIQDFIRELISFDIQYVIDVRSKPYSRWNPQYNRKALEASLKGGNINYIFMGDQLGGFPQDESCYDENGKVLYSKIKDKAFFKEGLERLRTAHNKKIRVAILCSETKPEICHRTNLIGIELMKSGISINHIISYDKCENQEEVLERIKK